MFLADAGHFCADTANIWRLLGYVVMIIKIVIPLALIVLGMIDLGKAVISSDEKAINKSVSSLVKRFVAAVVVFFIPTLVSALFNAVTNIDITNGDSNICIQCVTNVTSKSPISDNDGTTIDKSCNDHAKSAVGISGTNNSTDDNTNTDESGTE